MHALMEDNLDHPSRELMWGSPGSLLVALLLHQRTGEARWAMLFRRIARKLWSQLLWSSEHPCQYWMQEMYGKQGTFLDGVHGFVQFEKDTLHYGQMRFSLWTGDPGLALYLWDCISETSGFPTLGVF